MNRLPILPAVPTILTLVVLTMLSPVPLLASEPQAAAATGVPEPPPGTAVFEMKYRGQSTPDDPLSYHAFWGFGRSGGEKDPFVAAVKRQGKEGTPVYNNALPRAQWSFVEIKDRKPVAFYFDLNADGELSGNEKFLPAASAGSRLGFPYAFLTSDFTLQTQDRREIPFRVMLVAAENRPDNFNYMWSPACVLEGQATLAGELMRLILYTSGFDGSFTAFGSCSYALLGAQQKPEEYATRYPLSSLIQHKGTFYRLKLDDRHEKDTIVRVAFTKDTTPTGQLAVALQGKESLQSRVGPASITGAAGNSIYFNLPDVKSPLPEGRYRLSSGTIDYGAQKDNEWRATFNEGPAFEVNAGRTRQIEVGQVALAVRAIDENDRYRSDVKERSTFMQGTSIFLAPRITGKAGEVYTRFSQKDGGAGPLTDVKPHITILDSAGKQVAATDLEYG